jgi:hypothetical protein
MRRLSSPIVLRLLSTLSLSFLTFAGCAAELDVTDDPWASMVDEAESESASVVASATTRQVVRVKGPRGPVARARVATRDANGAAVDVAFTDAEGVAHVRTVPGGFVVAAAPAFAAGARLGAGDVRLVPVDAPERAVPRLRNGRIVSEVVRAGSGDDVAVPRAGGLGRAPAGTAVPAGRFNDLAGHPAAAHIEALASRGVIAGDPGGRFRPDAALTRAELVTLVLRAADIAAAPVSSSGFVDVAADAWFAAPVATARTLELVKGDPDGRFRPGDPVTRAELAAVLVRAGALPSADGAVPADVVGVHWARGALASAVGFCRLLDVDGRGAVRPDARATRADAAVALSRLASCSADRGLSRGTLLARRAAEGTWSTHRRHHSLVATTGLGTHYGDESAFHRLNLADKRAYVAARTTPGSTPLDPTQMTRSSCIEYAMELAGRGYTAVGRGSEWQRVDGAARNDRLAGTRLAAHLVDAGWRAVYVNSDTAWRGVTGPDNEHSYSLSVARSEQTYYDVPLAGAFLDWERDAGKKQAMDALPFGLYVMRGGTHVVAIADGAVHELARSEGPDGHVLYDDVWSAIIDVYARDVYGGGDAGAHKARAMWTSGVLMLPPGVELAGVEGL